MGLKSGWGARVEFCAGEMMVPFWEENMRNSWGRMVPHFSLVQRPDCGAPEWVEL